MSIKEFNADNIYEIPRIIDKMIEKNEINVCTMTRKLNINRKTFYNKLYGDKIDIIFLMDILKYLGVNTSIKLAIN